MARAKNKLRWRIKVFGIVQGVGFRPFVYRLAKEYGISGWVRNTSEGILVEAEGEESQLTAFIHAIRSQSPALASISHIETIPIEPLGSSDFEIQMSSRETNARTTVPPDTATCPECLADICSPGNRRFGYPFTNCTNCGPRFTIIERLPYDRPNTTMREFSMCPDCLAEYEHPANRRFHAQPNACPECGPHLMLDGICADDTALVTRAAQLLQSGKILAVKGLGGYHLACDARSSPAVHTLRNRKGRADKPFAVMCRDVDEARAICEVGEIAEKLLVSPERPIVLMQAKPNSGISKLVAPGTKSLGVMLPYTPLHYLLLRESPASLVMTSGNLSEEPIAYRDSDAIERLAPIADHILSHNRPIYMACDDSVIRVYGSDFMMVRRARGYVPRAIDLDYDVPQILACGADLKNTFCLTKSRLALLSQHLGDLDNAPTLEHYTQTIEHFCNFFEVQPNFVAHDLHPDYRSTRYAVATGIDLVPVQHHHAHIASCMGENNVQNRVIGVAFDGMGYGSDGKIWGGEFLIADFDGFQRAAHLAYVPLPGGDAATRRPGRMALAYLFYTFGADAETLALRLMPYMSSAEAYAVRVQIERGLNSPLTSSMGRLFDAVSALLGICTEVSYEGQAAIELEAVAELSECTCYGYRERGGMPSEIDVRPMILEIVRDIEHGVPPGVVSARFHATIAGIVANTCRNIRELTGLNTVALSGGVFQNVLLLGIVIEQLEASGFQVLRHRWIPCNDGGIPLGQALIAAQRCD